MIPHITDEIKARIRDAAEGVDIAIVEIGGTVGDIESLPFLEAIRQLKVEPGPQNAVSVHVTLVPYIAAAGELKTKPTQHSVKEMREIGIQPDILICRGDRPLEQDVKGKIALFSNVAVEVRDHRGRRRVHLRAAARACTTRASTTRSPSASTSGRASPTSAPWQRVVERHEAPRQGPRDDRLVGKYVHLRDSYKSLHEALVHGGLANDVQVELEYIDSEELTDDNGAESARAASTRILVPGGFGDRGTEGKIQAIRYARETGVPFFGICLGMQLAVIEFARHVCGLDRAPTARSSIPTATHPVIDLMPDQREVQAEGRHDAPRAPTPACSQPGSLAARRLRHDRDQRAPPPSLRGQQRLPRDARAARPRAQRACRPTAAWSRWSSCRVTRTSSAASSIPSSRAAPRAAPAVRALRGGGLERALQLRNKARAGEPAGAMVH